MVSQEILDTFIQEIMDGKFAVNDPTDFDQVIGNFNTKIEAENALKEYIVIQKIEFE
jgi:hypothetical protein